MRNKERSGTEKSADCAWIETLVGFERELILKHPEGPSHISNAVLRIAGMAELCPRDTRIKEISRIVSMFRNGYDPAALDLMSSSLLALSRRENGAVSRWLDLIEKNRRDIRFSLIIQLGKCANGPNSDMDALYARMSGCCDGKGLSTESARTIVLVEWARGVSKPPVLPVPRAFPALSRAEQHKVKGSIGIARGNNPAGRKSISDGSYLHMQHVVAPMPKRGAEINKI